MTAHPLTQLPSAWCPLTWRAATPWRLQSVSLRGVNVR